MWVLSTFLRRWSFTVRVEFSIFLWFISQSVSNVRTRASCLIRIEIIPNPRKLKSNCNHTTISLVLICPLDLNFVWFEIILLGTVFFRIKREAPERESPEQPGFFRECPSDTNPRVSEMFLFRNQNNWIDAENSFWFKSDVYPRWYPTVPKKILKERPPVKCDKKQLSKLLSKCVKNCSLVP